MRPSVLGVLSAGLALAALSCTTLPPPRVPVVPAPWPQARISVMSDPHLLSASLVEGPSGWGQVEAGAFQIFRDGPEVLQTRVASLLTERPDLVLITGDLTKEGERASHQDMVTLLSPLVRAGIPVLVIPGNHDVLNPQASSFGPQGPRPAPTVTPDDFARLYADFGYAAALSRDPASLSYVAEPIPGLRVLALDTARYEDNARRGRQVTAGRIRAASWPWIDQVLRQAARDRKAVVALMHHGLVEKFPGQGGLFADYLVADREEVQRRLAVRGVSVVLTGHFHSLSAARADVLGRPLWDIEGGTLSQYPLGYRTLTVSGSTLRVQTGQVTDLPSYEGRPGVFLARAQALAWENTGRLVESRLRQSRVPAPEARKITQLFSRAFAAVTAGDPSRPEDWVWPPEGLGPMGSLAVVALGRLPEDLWHPAEPPDREFELALPLPPGPGSD